MNYPGFLPDYPSPIYRVDERSPFDQIYKRVNHYKNRPIPPDIHHEGIYNNYHNLQMQAVPYNEIQYNNELNKVPHIYHERMPPPELPEIINQEMPDHYYNNNYYENAGYIERPPLDYQNQYNNIYYENEYNDYYENKNNFTAYERTLPKSRNNFSSNQKEIYDSKEWNQRTQNNYTNEGELDIPSYQATIQNKNKTYHTVINPNLNENLTFEQRRKKFLEKIDRKSPLSNIIEDPNLSAIENDNNYIFYDNQMNTAFETTFNKNVSPLKEEDGDGLKNIKEQKSEIVEIFEQSPFAKFLIVCVDFDKRIEKKKWQIYEIDNFKLISFYRVFLKERKVFVDIDDFRATLIKLFQIKLSKEEVEIIFSRVKKIGDGFKLNVMDFERLFLPLSMDSEKSLKAPLKPGEQEINIQIENNEVLKKKFLKMFRLILELEGFLKKLKSSLTKEISIEELFKEIDTGLKGFITNHNLQKFLKKNNFDVQTVDLLGIVRRFTRGSGSRINFVQFEKEMSDF